MRAELFELQRIRRQLTRQRQLQQVMLKLDI